MHSYPIKKFFSLLFLYIVIIVGIFILQFRSESVISINNSSLHITLAKTTDQNNQQKLKNTFSAVFNGLSIFADDKNPATIANNNNIHKLTLISWKQATPSNYIFTFSNDVILNLTVTTDTNNTKILQLSATLPESATSFSINYGPVQGYTIVKKDSKKILFGSHNISYQLLLSEASDNKIVLTKKQNYITYTKFIKTKTFSIDTVTDLPEAAEAAYKQTLQNYLDTLISVYTKNLSSLSETGATTYIAEMASRGKYNTALDNVPDSIKKASGHSYISSPYFGSLKTVEKSFEDHIIDMQELIKKAINNHSLEIFTNTDIPEYIAQNANSNNITKLLETLSESSNLTPTIQQAAEIIKTYNLLKQGNNSINSQFETFTKKCVQIIIKAITLNKNKITLSAEKNTAISNISAAQVGTALIAYGKISGNSNFTHCGYLIINTYISQSESLSIDILTQLYPILRADNNFYPHYLKLSNNIEIWTCANTITTTVNNNKAVTFDIDFPRGLSHYIILKGIKPFSAIQIYGLNFHTDPRFETYNSSGYVLIKQRNILLLKSRQKSQHEIIKIFYN